MGRDLRIRFATIFFFLTSSYTLHLVCSRVVFTFYLQTKFCTSGSAGSLGIVFKRKVEKHLCTIANILLNIL